MIIDSRKVINLILKKIQNLKNAWNEVYRKIFLRFFDKILENLRSRINIPQKYIGHIRNTTILAISYTISSLITYQEFYFETFAKEIFALLCTYGAIFLWFIEKIGSELKYKIIIGATASFAPILFVNNPFSVAMVEIFLIIIVEFSLFKYIKGCRLFSNLIPVYIICDTIEHGKIIYNFRGKYKILELIVLSSDIDEQETSKISELKSINEIKNKLSKINRLSFFPMPRRIMYFSEHYSANVLINLLEISSEFSIPVFKISYATSGKQSMNISPISFQDFDCVQIGPHEKSMMSILNGKQIWIFYDGKKATLDLIYSIYLVNPANLTVLCETEYLASMLSNEMINHDIKIKIMDIDMLLVQNSNPDILFYNMPIKAVNTCEENLKEALIRNVLHTQKIVKYAQNKGIKHVFIMSGPEALNAKNWIGATQRLGELIAQHASSKCNKPDTKLSVIRVPESITDQSSVFGKVTSSILSNGYIDFKFPESEGIKAHHRNDIIRPLLELIVYLLKKHDNSSDVYTIIPKNTVHLGNFIKLICNTFCLRIRSDIKMKYNTKHEMMNLDDFLNISENFETTDIEYVVSTKFNKENEDAFRNPIWDVEEIKKMNTRELISSVFQNLSEKVKNRSPARTILGTDS
jgi:hypothetical protein